MSPNLGVVLIGGFALLVGLVFLAARLLRTGNGPNRPHLNVEATLDPIPARQAAPVPPQRRPHVPARTSQTWPPTPGTATGATTASGAHRPARRPHPTPAEVQAGRHATDSVTSAMPSYRPPQWRIPPYTR